LGSEILALLGRLVYFIENFAKAWSLNVAAHTLRRDGISPWSLVTRSGPLLSGVPGDDPSSSELAGRQLAAPDRAHDRSGGKADLGGKLFRRVSERTRSGCTAIERRGETAARTLVSDDRVDNGCR
jgi:hypothetical protein